MYKIREYPHMSPITFEEEKQFNSLEDVKKKLKPIFKNRHIDNKYVIFNNENMIVAIIDRKTYLFNR